MDGAPGQQEHASHRFVRALAQEIQRINQFYSGKVQELEAAVSDFEDRDIACEDIEEEREDLLACFKERSIGLDS